VLQPPPTSYQLQISTVPTCQGKAPSTGTLFWNILRGYRVVFISAWPGMSEQVNICGAYSMFSSHLRYRNAFFAFSLQHFPKFRELLTGTTFPGASHCRFWFHSFARRFGATRDKIFCQRDNTIKFRNLLNCESQSSLLDCGR